MQRLCLDPLSAYLLLHVSTGTEILRTRVFGRTEIRGTKTDHCSEHRDRKGRVMMTMMITVKWAVFFSLFLYYFRKQQTPKEGSDKG